MVIEHESKVVEIIHEVRTQIPTFSQGLINCTIRKRRAYIYSLNRIILLGLVLRQAFRVFPTCKNNNDNGGERDSKKIQGLLMLLTFSHH